MRKITPSWWKWMKPLDRKPWPPRPELLRDRLPSRLGLQRRVGRKTGERERGIPAMTLQALLFSTDDTASAVVGQALPACGIAVERCSDSATAISRMHQQKFDALVLDFDDAQGAAEVL